MSNYTNKNRQYTVCTIIVTTQYNIFILLYLQLTFIYFLLLLFQSFSKVLFYFTPPFFQITSCSLIHSEATACHISGSALFVFINKDCVKKWHFEIKTAGSMT